LERNHGSPFDEEDAPLNIQQWEKHIEDLKGYAQERPNKLREDLMEHFNLTTGTYELITTVEPQEAGYIQINSISNQSLHDRRGIYFNGIPVVVTAIPNEGHQFQSGRAGKQSSQITIETTTANQIHLHAIFD
jgi:hypothetical protein